MKTHLFTSALLLILGSLVQATVPNIINYQGRISSNGELYTGTGEFKFALVDGGTVVTPEVRTAAATATVSGGFLTIITVTDGGLGYTSTPTVTITDSTGANATAIATISDGVVTGVTVTNPGSSYSSTPTVTISAPPSPPSVTNYATYWSNDGTSTTGNEPASAISTQVANGIYNISLGDTALAGMAAINGTTLDHNRVCLRIWFKKSTDSTFKQLTPDVPLNAVPYALHANQASTVPDGAITGSKLAAGTITGDKFASGAIGQALNNDGLGFVAEPQILYSTSPADPTLLNKGYKPYYKEKYRIDWNGISTGPSSRLGHVMESAGDKMIVWSGKVASSTSSTHLSDGYIFDLDRRAWTLMSTTNALTPRCFATSVWTGDKFFIWGGLNGESCLGDGAFYDPATDQWTPISGSGAPTARANAFGALINGKIFVWGGHSGSYFGPTTSLNSGGIYDLATNTWTAMSTVNGPSGYTNMYREVVSDGNGAIYCWNLNTTLFKYDVNLNAWSSITSLNGPSARTSCAVAYYNDKVFVWGGWNVDHGQGDGYFYDLKTDAWVKMKDAPCTPRGNMIVGVYNNNMLIYGGSDSSGICSDWALYDMANDSWVSGSYASLGPRLYDKCAVTIRTKIIIWGGRINDSTSSSTGASLELGPEIWVYFKE